MKLNEKDTWKLDLSLKDVASRVPRPTYNLSLRDPRSMSDEVEIYYEPSKVSASYRSPYEATMPSVLGSYSTRLTLRDVLKVDEVLVPAISDDGYWRSPVRLVRVPALGDIVVVDSPFIEGLITGVVTKIHNRGCYLSITKPDGDVIRVDSELRYTVVVSPPMIYSLDKVGVLDKDIQVLDRMRWSIIEKYINSKPKVIQRDVMGTRRFRDGIESKMLGII